MIVIIRTILTLLCLLGLFIGIFYTTNSNEKKRLIGWIILAIAIGCNGISCVLNGHYILGAINFVVAYFDYSLYKKNKEELRVKEIDLKEMFLNEINNYKKKK